VSESPQPQGHKEAPPELLTAIRQFNAGEYYACHETLEELWISERGVVRRMYQGILQIGVGLYHLQRGNEAGARNLLRRGSDQVRAFAPECCGLDLTALVSACETLLVNLESRDSDYPCMVSAEDMPRIAMLP